MSLRLYEEQFYFDFSLVTNTRSFTPRSSFHATDCGYVSNICAQNDHRQLLVRILIKGFKSGETPKSGSGERI